MIYKILSLIIICSYALKSIKLPSNASHVDAHWDVEINIKGLLLS